MRQGNGTDLLGMNDPRSAKIGVIYVSPSDDRTSVFAAILTQEKLNREHILIVLPETNKAFESAKDLDDLRTVKRKLNGDLIFIVPEDSELADLIAQRQFPMYSSLEEYTEFLREDSVPDEEEDDIAPAPEPSVGTKTTRRGGFFGRRAPAAGAAAGGAALGAAVSESKTPVQDDRSLDDNSVDGSVTPVTPSRASAIDTPLPQQDEEDISSVTPMQSRPVLDDDDALDEPSAPVGRRGSNSGATGYIPADRTRQRRSSVPLAGVPDDDDDEDDWELSEPALAADAAAHADAPSTPPSNAAIDEDEEDDSSDIIDLQPVTHSRGPRSTLKLNEKAPAANANVDDDDDDIIPLVSGPLSASLRKRRTGSMATAAAGGALAAASVSASAASNSNGGTASRPVAGALPPRRPAQPGKRRRSSRGPVWLWLPLLLILTLIVALIVCELASPTAFQTVVAGPVSRVLPNSIVANPASVTITPDSKTESNSFVVHAVTKNPDANNLQVSMRNLSATPPAQTQSVTGTGKGQTAATYAEGTIKFYSLNTTAITVSTGTVFTTTSGIKIVTEKAANIPAAQVSVDGSNATSYTVPAHVTTAGTAGNLAANSINQSCCAADVHAVSGAFSGGQNAVSYTYVQQSDVDSVVTPLKNTLTQQAKTTFNKQLRSNERLASDPQCKTNTSVPNGSVGDQGSNIASVKVTVSASCTGVAYDYQGAQSVTQQRLQTQAARELGTNYKLVGGVVPSIKSVTPQDGGVSMVTNAQGVWVYQFSNSAKQQLAHLLAGKKLTDAQRLLAQQAGIKSADIKLRSGDTLPGDATQITIAVKDVSGLSNGTATPATGTSTPTATQEVALPPLFEQVIKFLKG